MQRLLAAIVFTVAISVQASTPSAKVVSEQDAVQIAKSQLLTSRPDLEVVDRVPYGNDFVSAGPESGGGPKWVIGFLTTERKSGRKLVYYVTVFPDGRTSKDEIRPGATS